MNHELIMEINFKLSEKLLIGDCIISWHYLRGFCESDEECDKICGIIQKSLGFKIVYQGSYLNFEEK